MEFLLSNEQIEIQDTVKRFVEDTCPSTTLHEIFDSEDGFSAPIWQGLVEMGIPAMCVPEEFGGLGMELLDLATIAEVLGYNATPGPFLGHSLATLAINAAGSDEQKAKWLPQLAAGEVIASFACAEPGDRWLTEALTMSAAATLNGEKQFVLYARHADLLVVALADGKFAVVEKDAAGISITDLDVADRTRRVFNVSFTDTPAEILAGGADAAAKVQDAALVLLSADGFGGASRCIELAVEYAKTRSQFGQVIGKFQALKHQLANMAVDAEPMRGLYWHSAYAYDHEPDQASRQAALAKAHIGERFLQTARDTIEAHGGIGYTWECDTQIMLKRALFNFAYMGTPGLHRRRAADLAGW